MVVQEEFNAILKPVSRNLRRTCSAPAGVHEEQLPQPRHSRETTASRGMKRSTMPSTKTPGGGDLNGAKGNYTMHFDKGNSGPCMLSGR
jgi:hypothetical protein